MRFQPFSLRCECGVVPRRIKQVGLTSAHQFVVHWRCAGCRRELYVVKDLSECWRECPPAAGGDESVEAAESAELMREPDAAFLHSLGVKFPDE